MGISPSEWEEVKALLEEALRLKPAEVPSFLDQKAVGENVRHELERLLAYRSVAGGFLSSPVLRPVTVSTTSRLKEGTVLCKRFEVVRFIAAGGMGEIYEARDVELRETVAIKMIRQDLVSQPGFPQRFRREVHLAKQVTHPNVCRIYDLFRHSESDGDYVFVSMELLNGETLAERLKNKGRMSMPEAFPVILQITEALNAAHVAGILHRDFKPGNVILVPQTETNPVRAVVTDFGLALQSGEDNASGSFSSHGGLIGTPAYMSPEQIEGHELTTASDIYSLGLVMYEVLTGKAPFDAATPLLSVMKRLDDPPVGPRAFCPDIDRTVEKVILRCLERHPSSRPQAREIIATLRGINQDDAQEGHRRRLGRWRRIAAVMCLVALAGLGVFYRVTSVRANRLTARDTVVIADFTNKTGNPLLDDALKQGLRVDLEQSPNLSIVSDERVFQLLRYMGRPDETRVTGAVAREVCQRAGSKAMLLGSISSIGNNFAIGLEAVNCNTEDPLVNLQVEAAGAENVLTKLHAAGTEMRRMLGESLASIERYDTPVEQATTSSLEALHAYSAALRIKRSQGDTAAVPLLKRAVDLDQNFAMAYAVLGLAYSNLGEIGLSAASAKRAYDLRNRGTEKERLDIESVYYNLVTGELNQEIKVYEQWKETYPRDSTPYRRLAYCLGYLGQYEKAAEGFREALKLDPDNVVNYLGLAATYLNINDLDRAQMILGDLQKRKLQHEYIPQLYYLLAFLRDDATEMNKWTSPSSWMPAAQDMLFSVQADTEAFHGRIRNARDFSRRAVEFANQNDATGRAIFAQARDALREAEFGNTMEARRQAAAALSHNPGEDSQVDATVALAFARSGDIARAHTLAKHLSERFPSNLWVNKYWLPCIRAAVEISQRRPKAAIEALQTAEPYEMGGDPIAWDNMYPIYLRGQAYLMQRQGKEASAEFQKLFDHPGRIGNSPLGSLARLQFARACALSGERAKALMAYEEFLKLWKDADPDVRLRHEAEIEYARL